MKKTKYIIIVLIVLVVLILAIFSGKAIFNSLTDIFDFGTDNYNTIIKESVSPDEKYVAYYFQRDVDATTDVSYQLSVCERGESLSNDSGNVFVSSKPFVFEWQSENKLLIVHGNSSETFKKEDSIKDVEIKYSTTLKTGVYTQSDISGYSPYIHLTSNNSFHIGENVLASYAIYGTYNIDGTTLVATSDVFNVTYKFKIVDPKTLVLKSSPADSDIAIEIPKNTVLTYNKEIND